MEFAAEAEMTRREIDVIIEWCAEVLEGSDWWAGVFCDAGQAVVCVLAGEGDDGYVGLCVDDFYLSD